MTHLTAWLRERRMSILALSEQTGITRDALTMLANPGKRSRNHDYVSISKLRIVAEVTGIDPGVLIRDAMEWEKDDAAQTEAAAE